MNSAEERTALLLPTNQHAIIFFKIPFPLGCYNHLCGLRATAVHLVSMKLIDNMFFFNDVQSLKIYLASSWWTIMILS